MSTQYVADQVVIQRFMSTSSIRESVKIPPDSLHGHGQEKGEQPVMNIKRIAAVSLTYDDFPSFDAKLIEACRLVALAAAKGADLVVLPEVLNQWRGDGPNNPNPITMDEMVLDDWESQCAKLLDCGLQHEVAITVPVFVREGDHILNVCNLVDRYGTRLGRYAKEYPTLGEMEMGVVPGENPRLMEWSGLKVGGAICYDINFQPLFARQKQEGANLFLCPSLWPGGLLLNYYAFEYEVPIVLASPAWSRIIDPLGEERIEGGLRNETLRWGGTSPVFVAEFNFDYAVVSSDCSYDVIREVERAYAGRLSVRLHQQNCCFYVENLADDVSIDQILAEHGLSRRKQELNHALEKIEHSRKAVCDIVGLPE
jgi:predicted amidohydrolase